MTPTSDTASSHTTLGDLLKFPSVCAAADIGIYIMPPSGQHLRQGASTYCFFTVGPAIAAAVDFWVLDFPKSHASGLIVAAGNGYGEERLLTHLQEAGFQHSFGKVTGLLIGLLVGPEQWGGAAEEAERTPS